jgi:protoheme ferro-lyase
MNHNTITVKTGKIDDAFDKLINKPLITKDELEEIYKKGLETETKKCEDAMLNKLKEAAEHGRREVVIDGSFRMNYSETMVNRAVADLKEQGFRIIVGKAPTRAFTISF